jgi:hypothetical protein
MSLGKKQSLRLKHQELWATGPAEFAGNLGGWTSLALSYSVPSRKRRSISRYISAFLHSSLLMLDPRIASFEKQ